MRTDSKRPCFSFRTVSDTNGRVLVHITTILCVLVVFQIPQQGLAQDDVNASSSLSDIMFKSVWGGYQPSVRPVCGPYPSTTTVAMGIALRQIQDLDEPKQVLSTNLWLRVSWKECRLTWNSAVWNNLTRLIVPYKSIWTPDLTLYDNADSALTGLKDFRLVLADDGTVKQQVPLVIRSLCQLDISRFPFDTQTCYLTFGSWAYNGYEINLTSSESPVDLGSFVSHVEWAIASLTVHRTEPFYSGVPYPQVIFTLVLRRKYLFYILSVLFPCALIQAMAALAFLLPCETNEKVGLDITVLLSLAVMQLVILEMIPASSETLPLIGIYFMLSMIVVSLSCLMTVIVLAVHYPNRHRPLPPWARAILNFRLVRWLGVDIKSLQKKAPRFSINSVNNAPEQYISKDTSTYPVSRAKDTDTDAAMHDLNPFVNVSGYPARTLHELGHHDIDVATNAINATSGVSPTRDVNGFSDVVNLYSSDADVTKTSNNDVGLQPAVPNPSDVSPDGSSVSFSYGVEGARGKRVTFRPLNADSPRLMQRALEEMQISRQGELQYVVTLCQQILQCMKTGRKSQDQKEKFSNKASRREWELMAIFLDRVFLIVFCLLTVSMSAYVYGSIA